MNEDQLKNIYLGVIGVLTLLLMWSGWRQGVARQLMTLLAIVGAYFVGWYGGPTVAPLFDFLRYPQPATLIIGSIAAGLLTFIAIRILRVAFFKKTAQFGSKTARVVHGSLGAFVGLVFGGILFMVSADAIRILGTIATVHVQAADQQKKALEATGPKPGTLPVEEPNALIRGLAKLSSAIDQGSTGEFLKKYDPVPKNVYATIAKLAIMASSQESLDRFLEYPGVAKLASNPKLLALRSDPSVSELLAKNSYFKLLRHEKVVELASDPEFAAEIKKVDFDEALNAALKSHPARGL